MSVAPRRILRATLRALVLFVVAPYAMLVLVAVVLEAWSEATTTEPLPVHETHVPSKRVGAVPPRPLDTPPPVERIAPTPSTLPDRAVAFMRRRGGEGRLHDEEARFREFAILAEDVTRRSLDVPPELVLAISFRESSWDPSAEGDAGEIGLMQVKGREVLSGFPEDAVRASPSLQLWLGVRRYEAALDACHGNRFAALLNYASGNCDGPLDYAKRERAIWSANRVLEWADGMRSDR